MKESYYFSHDCNARHDPKITKMLLSLGSSGYGVFWVIIEMLRESKNYEMNLSDIDAIAYQSHSDIDTVDKVIRVYELFTLDKNGVFWSESLKNRMALKEQKSKIYSENSKKRWNGNAIAMQSECNGNPLKESKAKEKKIKENKANKNKHLEAVFLTDKEYTNLETQYGSLGLKERIENLNNYILSQGKNYKSHYHTLLVWEAKNKKDVKLSPLQKMLGEKNG